MGVNLLTMCSAITKLSDSFTHQVSNLWDTNCKDERQMILAQDHDQWQALLLVVLSF
jgi:hypothetical protein